MKHNKSNFFKEFLKTQKLMHSIKEKWNSELNKVSSTIQNVRIPDTTITGIQKSFQQINDVSKTMANVFEQISKLLAQQNPVFIEEDWYLSEFYYRKLMIIEMYVIDPVELEKLLLNLFDENYDLIKNTLIQKHENRYQIINELFTAFENKLFHSVVILSYSITDGISKEKFGLNFWGYDKNNDLTHSSRISELIDSESVLNLVRKRLNVRGESNLQDKHIEEKEKFCSNNRHCVIHGDSYLYGTKVNAVKSIFLLDSISSLQRNEPAN